MHNSAELVLMHLCMCYRNLCVRNKFGKFFGRNVDALYVVMQIIALSAALEFAGYGFPDD